jgi:hypothetical protein
MSFVLQGANIGCNHDFLFTFLWCTLLYIRNSKMAVFWVLAPCSLVQVYRSFRGACCLLTSTRLHGATTQKHSHLRTRRRENLKSHIYYCCYFFYIHIETDCGRATWDAGESLVQNSRATMVALGNRFSTQRYSADSKLNYVRTRGGEAY